jgi:hypothetical protein
MTSSPELVLAEAPARNHAPATLAAALVARLRADELDALAAKVAVLLDRPKRSVGPVDPDPQREGFGPVDPDPHPAHRPIAIRVAYLLALLVLRAALLYGVLRPERAAMADLSAPFTSPLALAAVYLDGAMFPAETLGTAVIVASFYRERPRRSLVALAGGWLLAAVALAVLYLSPLVRGTGVARVYFAAVLASVMMSAACVVRFAERQLSANKKCQNLGPCNLAGRGELDAHLDYA